MPACLGACLLGFVAAVPGSFQFGFCWRILCRLCRVGMGCSAAYRAGCAILQGCRQDSCLGIQKCLLHPVIGVLFLLHDFCGSGICPLRLFQLSALDPVCVQPLGKGIQLLCTLFCCLLLCQQPFQPCRSIPQCLQLLRELLQGLPLLSGGMLRLLICLLSGCKLSAQSIIAGQLFGQHCQLLILLLLLLDQCRQLFPVLSGVGEAFQLQDMLFVPAAPLGNALLGLLDLLLAVGRILLHLCQGGA